LLPLQVREWVNAGSAFAMTSQQSATLFSLRPLRALKSSADPFGQSWNVGLTKCSYRDLFMRAINGDRFQRGIFGQSIYHRTRQTSARVCFRTVFMFRTGRHI